MDGFLAIASLLLEKEVIFADDLERILGPRKGAKDNLLDDADETETEERKEGENTVPEETAGNADGKE